jgi:hypothetical protein
MVRRHFVVGVTVLAALAVVGPAQSPIVINEVHGLGSSASPALPGDYLELWNQSATPYDLAGHVIGIWSGDTGTVSSVTIPCTPEARHIIPGNCFWILQEGTAVGSPLTGTLAGLPGMIGLPTPWSSSSSMGARVLDPAGNCIAYVYLRRATTALPATPPNILPPAAWTLGNLGTTGTSLGHIQRLANTNTDSFADWGHDATSNAGTPGAPNTTGAALQTPIGACVPVSPSIGPAWETNGPEASLDLAGAVGSAAKPGTYFLFVNGVATLNLGSTLAGQGWELAVTVTPAVAAPTICGPGAGWQTGFGQAVNLDLTAPDLSYLNALALPPFPGSVSIPLTAAYAVPAVSGQFLITNPARPEGYELSASMELHSGTMPGTIAGPATDDSTVALEAALPIFGTVYTRVYVVSNGRVTFGASVTDPSPTTAEAISGKPFFGAWVDLNPSIAGSGQITISTPVVDCIRVDYAAVRYYSSTLATQIATFALELHGNGDLKIDGLAGITDPGALVRTMYLGISKGDLGATDGGATVYALGGPNVPANATDMIYATGQAGSLTPGLSTLLFTPLTSGPAAGSYAWSGF